MGLSINHNDDICDLISMLRAEGYEALDLTDNEMAKLHVRYMVGEGALLGILRTCLSS